MSRNLKIKLDDTPLFDDTPPPPFKPHDPVLATYDQPVKCTFCKAFCTTSYTNPTAPMCQTCYDHADERRTRIEKKIVAFETWRQQCFDHLAQTIAATDQVSVTRYHNAVRQWHDAVESEDADALMKIETAIDKAISQQTPLGHLLKTWREVNKAALKATGMIAKWDDHHYLLSQTPKGRAWQMPAELRKPIPTNEPAEQMNLLAA